MSLSFWHYGILEKKNSLIVGAEFIVHIQKSRIMHLHDGHFGGMHLIWWIVWVVLLVWIFFTPYNIPYQRTKKEDPLDILKKRFAKGEITKEEFEESKKVLESDK